MSTNSGKNIVLAGEGGQGVQKIAQALNIAALKDRFSTYINSFGVEQRGTPSLAYVKVSDKNIFYPRFKYADICLIMNSRSIGPVESHISANTDIIFDSSTLSINDLPKATSKTYALPATKLAKDKYHPRSYNIILYGVVCRKLGLDKNTAWQAILEVLGQKFNSKEIEVKNKDAFEFGYEAVLEHKEYSKPQFDTKKSVTIYRNKEKKAEIVPKRCKGCLICVLKCPVKALKPGEDLGIFSTPVPEIDLDKCITCGNCRRFCPDGAISVEKLN